MDETEIKASREADDKWTFTRLMLLAAATVGTGLTIIYFISP